MALNIMLQGTMSNAGKSLLAAGLCRIFRQDGYQRRALQEPEHGAQFLHYKRRSAKWAGRRSCRRRPAGLEPDVRMNPILLKPTTDVGSQVIVNGQVRGNMRAMEYYAKKREFAAGRDAMLTNRLRRRTT